MNTTQPLNQFRTRPAVPVAKPNTFCTANLTATDRFIDRYILSYHPDITEKEKPGFRREIMKVGLVYIASALALVGIVWFLAH